MELGKKLFIHLQPHIMEMPLVETLIDNKIDDKPPTRSQAAENKLAIDLIEDKANYFILAPVAGIPENYLTISMDSDILTINGKLPKECYDLGNPVYQECNWGQFSRSITLPKNIKRTGSKATLKNGLLTITLPKLKTQSTKKIKITSYDD